VIAGAHALVTGGGTGIGAAIAKALASRGASVTICGRRAEPLQALVAGVPGLHAVPADVTDPGSIAALYKEATTARGPFSIVIANAGAAESAPAERVSGTLWDKTIAVNLTGAFLSVQPALFEMRRARRGRIVFIASTAGLKGYAYVAPYVAAKHGVVGLARALAVELAPAGVTVNAVCPGYAETPMLDASVARIADKTSRTPEEARAMLSRTNPQGRFVSPEEVADAVLWLCGAQAGAVTGQAIAVAGGEI
jgi:NAD(P)-dependent dehydrogenase (short-subunit alcohol dehydrogenase family)